MTMQSLAVAVTLLVAVAASAHDTWVQTNTNVLRIGDNVHIDLMLGNHGNDHRDFKLASKIDLAGTTLEVLAPDGKRYDVKDRLADIGYTPKEGYWTVRFAGAQPGLYLVAHTSCCVIPGQMATAARSVIRVRGTARRQQAKAITLAAPKPTRTGAAHLLIQPTSVRTEPVRNSLGFRLPPPQGHAAPV